MLLWPINNKVLLPNGAWFYTFYVFMAQHILFFGGLMPPSYTPDMCHQGFWVRFYFYIKSFYYNITYKLIPHLNYSNATYTLTSITSICSDQNTCLSKQYLTMFIGVIQKLFNYSLKTK